MLLPDRDQRLRFLESHVEHEISDSHKRLSSADAKVHLRNGLGARHYMLRHSRETLERTCSNGRRGALSADTATEAALHLNGYYLNLRGALDNLAWMLQLELQLIPGVTDESGSRKSIHLFGEKFSSALRSRSAAIAAHVSAMKTWGDDLALLRDPAAHRIPLYVPPSVITTQEQMDEFRRLDQLSGAPEEELGGKRRIEIIWEARQVAPFIPVFCVTSLNGIKVYNILGQLLRDHRRYLHLTRKILGALQ